MFIWLKNLLGFKTAEAVKEVEKKIETVATEVKTEVAAVEAKVAEAIKCGCGRSPTGFCVGLHALPDDLWATHPDNPVKLVVKEVKALETAVEAKVEAVVEKVKKAQKPKKKKGE
jgi:hypothetical protein